MRGRQIFLLSGQTHVWHHVWSSCQLEFRYACRKRPLQIYKKNTDNKKVTFTTDPPRQRLNTSVIPSHGCFYDQLLLLFLFVCMFVSFQSRWSILSQKNIKIKDIVMLLPLKGVWTRNPKNIKKWFKMYTGTPRVCIQVKRRTYGKYASIPEIISWAYTENTLPWRQVSFYGKFKRHILSSHPTEN